MSGGGKGEGEKILSSSLETEFCMDYYSATFLTSREKKRVNKRRQKKGLNEC